MGVYGAGAASRAGLGAWRRLWGRQERKWRRLWGRKELGMAGEHENWDRETQVLCAAPGVGRYIYIYTHTHTHILLSESEYP